MSFGSSTGNETFFSKKIAPLCTQCGKNPCRENQRNCLECHREAQRTYRANQKLKIETERAELERLRKKAKPETRARG